MYGAIFHPLSSPFYPDYSRYYNGNVYKGLFLNQEYDPNGQNPFYSIRSPIQQPNDLFLTQTGRSHKFYFRNWSSSGTDPLTQNNIVSGYYETPVVFRSTNATVTANLKGTQLSNNADAYSNNSQRKFIRTPNGRMYITYESMGYVWLERSTDNGTTWELMHYGKPIGNTLGKSPSMDYDPSGNLIVISYQEYYYSDYKCRYVVYHTLGNSYRYGDVEFETNPELISGDAQMVVAWNGNGNALFVAKGYEGIHYVLCQLTATTTTWIESSKGSFGSNDHATPTLYATKINVGTSDQYFHLAYQKNYRDICYRKLTWSSHQVLTVGGEEVVSNNTGYSLHYGPSITVTDWVVSSNRYEHIRLAWLGYRNAYDDNPPCVLTDGETRTLFKTRSPSIWTLPAVYGNNVVSVSTNKGTNVTDYWEPFAITWSEGINCNYPNKYIRSHDGTQPPIRSLNTTGSEIQLNNGTDFSSMYVNSFNRPSLPYYFTLSQNLSGGMEKIESMAIFLGREGVITKDSTDFYYAVGDVTLDGQNIDFIEMPDSLVINNIQTMNNHLFSEPFTVSNTSILTYGIQYGIIDSLQAVNTLSDGSEINFKVELVDNQTGEVLGVFDEISYSSENVFQYNNFGYQVDLTGIGNRTVLLRLSVGTTAACDYSISNRYSDTEILNKNGYKQISYKESMLVKEYALDQNYPNPFNPTTTIKYQIPNSGNVSIKVYDILGNEVAKLVDGYMESGKYEVDFDASSLASGVYIYRLNVNDFVNVKKMVLLK